MDGFLDAWRSFSGQILDMLPTSPTLDSDAISALAEYAGYINYFFPVGKFAAYFSALLTCCLAYQAASVILRWLKVIR